MRRFPRLVIRTNPSFRSRSIARRTVRSETPIRLATSYDVRGLPQTITSYDNPAVGSGTVVNEVQFAYNDFGQLITDYQSHGGAVNTSTSPKVQYGYADGSANTVRPTGITYPDGRVLSFDYGTAGASDDQASRIGAIKQGALALAVYDYLGLGSVVGIDEAEPQLRHRLYDSALTDSIYTALDRFSRIVDSRWEDYGASTDAARIGYGYNRDGSRIWRENTVAAALGKSFDELYGYDGLQRLKLSQRGKLNAGHTALTSTTFAQCWTLDETGNWKRFQQDDTGSGTWDLQQQRSANPVNEITNITETAGPSWITPAYNPAGNMTSVPQPSDPTKSYTATYDAWNRLVKLIDGANTVQENEYDARNFRTVRKEYTAGVLSETRHYYYSSGWQVLEERVDSSTAPNRQYVWGLRYIDDLILRDRDTTGNGTLDERLYAMQDANWNVTAVTDQNGDVQDADAKAQDWWIPNGGEIMPLKGAHDGPSKPRIILDAVTACGQVAAV